MNKFLSPLLFLLIAIVFGSCCDRLKGSSQVGDLEEVRWLLVDFDNRAVPSSGIVVTFDSQDKMVYGQSPCNNFFASYSLDHRKGQNITIGSVANTLKLCPDVDTTISEALAARLQGVKEVRIEAHSLLMFDAQGALVAIFERQQQEE
ncbi:MAG: META domain-containing protein [Rikenellaceae bacterium]